ncbi:MAG: hypothetical protein KF904_06395 [Rhodoblastus sp.]|nr:hypothetical protein [Rhodoblastus sp.]
MSDRDKKHSFAARPGDVDSWIKAPDAALARRTESDAFTARLTIDVTPDMRGRIKIAAFSRGVTVAEMLREFFAREFPEPTGEGQ